MAQLLGSRKKPATLLANFTWTAPCGEQGKQRAFLPMMGWLATHRFVLAFNIGTRFTRG
jgi:hypothetical protein